MPQVTIYHNPRCSKSRRTLQLLRDRQIEPQVIFYLEAPPSVEALRAISEMLGIEPAALIRKKDYRALGLPNSDDPEVLLRQIADHPSILERPIVVVDKKACLGRPPEHVLELL